MMLKEDPFLKLGGIYLHKDGFTYVVIGTAREAGNDTEHVVYVCQNDHYNQWWLMPDEDFRDGRFTLTGIDPVNAGTEGEVK